MIYIVINLELIGQLAKKEKNNEKIFNTIIFLLFL
jgi:hypothetical protein